MTAFPASFDALLERVTSVPSEDAIPILQHASVENPADIRLLLLLAAEFAQAGRLDEAESTYIALLQRAPETAIARFQLGLLQFVTARPAAAQATWAPLNLLAGDDPLRLFKEGLECLAKDQFEDARQLLRKGISTNGHNSPLNKDMHLILGELERIAPERSGEQAVAEENRMSGDVGGGEHFLVSAYRNLH